LETIKLKKNNKIKELRKKKKKKKKVSDEKKLPQKISKDLINI